MKNYAIGIDVGGTTCKLGLFTTDGKLLMKDEIPTNTENGGSKILPDLAAKVDSILADRRIEKDSVAGIGIGVPGPVSDDGVVNHCVNLGWGVLPIEDELGKLSGLPVKAGNDANVAALGEAWMGAGKDFQSIIMVTLGTGVGGGIILHDKILTGANGAGGEMGHMNVNVHETEKCNCGLSGCLEQYASATGVVRLAKQHLAASDEASELRSQEAISAKSIYDAAKDGDKMALDIVDEMCDYLGRALATLACTIDPEAFILGGGVSKNGPILTDTVKKYFEKYAFHACKNTSILLASLSNDAGIFGGAKLAIDL